MYSLEDLQETLERFEETYDKDSEAHNDNKAEVLKEIRILKNLVENNIDEINFLYNHLGLDKS